VDLVFGHVLILYQRGIVRYRKSLRRDLVAGGFEIGVHGLHHDGKLFSSRKSFDIRCDRINKYLKEWRSAGFSLPQYAS